MKKILILPLDERPCNYTFNQLLVKETDYEAIVPPLSILGDKKKAGDVNKIAAWLLSAAKKADGAILALDTLVYGGIVPSRLYHDEVDVLLERLNLVKEIKRINPSLKIYAYNLIMRNPSYASSEEEPDYYETWGYDIHRYGVITHKQDLHNASKEELVELAEINARLPREFLNDYIERRDKNILVNQAFLSLIAEGYIEFGIVPQDDSSPYGLTALDQIMVRKTIEDLNIELKVYMYPGADEVTNTLLARMINEDHHFTPRVYVKYSSVGAGKIIPLYEDRYLNETIKYQILAAGAMPCTSEVEADIILMVNAPSEHMQEANHFEKRGISYDSFRTLIEYVEYSAYAIDVLNKSVVIADVAYANGGDRQLLKLLKQKGLLYRIAGYAGWNTSSNTLGTCIAQGMINHLYPNRKAHLDFLALRYVEDVGYCSFVRSMIAETLPAGTHYYLLDGKRGKVVSQIKEKLEVFTEKHLTVEGFKIKITDIYSPWNRMFETGLTVEVTHEN